MGHHRGRGRRGHRVACHAPHAAAGPLRPGGPPAVHRPQHGSVLDRRPRCGRPSGPAARRAPVDGIDVLSRVGNAAHPRCRPGAAECRDGSRRRRRPRQRRTVAAPGPPSPHPLGRRSPGGAGSRRRRHLVMSQGRSVVGSMAGPTTAARGELLAQVHIAAQPYAGLTGVPRRLPRCGRRPPVGAQLLEGQGGGVVSGRDVDDEQARLAHQFDPGPVSNRDQVRDVLRTGRAVMCRSGRSRNTVVRAVLAVVRLSGGWQQGQPASAHNRSDLPIRVCRR